MEKGRLILFYCAVAFYAIYNGLWLMGTMFSFGPQDTATEFIFFVTAFVVDIPVLFWIARSPYIGLIALAVVIVAGLTMAAFLRVLNGATFLLWYAPKLIPIAAAVWSSRLARLIHLQQETP